MNGGDWRGISRIKGLSEIRRLPRLGKIRLGERRTSRGGKEYPAALGHFKFDEESVQEYPAIVKLYGSEPTELDIVLPLDETEKVFPQAYKLYGSGRGLKCKGDGERAFQRVCSKCNSTDCDCEDPAFEFTETACPCKLKDTGHCRPMGSLMVMLPKVSLAGVWQIDTSSYHSIVDLNSGIDFVRALCGRVAMIPLKLRLVARTVHPEGQATTVHTLQLECGLTQERILIDHNTEETIATSHATDCFCGFTVYPISKLTPERVSNIIREHGSERMMVNGSADWGISDPCSLPKVVEYMRGDGHSEETIERIVHDTADTFYSHSPHWKPELDLVPVDPREFQR